MDQEKRDALTINYGMVWGSLATFGVSFLDIYLWLVPLVFAIVFLVSYIRR